MGTSVAITPDFFGDGLGASRWRPELHECNPYGIANVENRSCGKYIVFYVCKAIALP